MHGKQNSAHKQKWMAHAERIITDAIPELAGKMDWDTLTYLYNQGEFAQTAAVKIINLHQGKSSDAP